MMFLSAATLIKGGAVLWVWLGEAITAVTHQQRVTGDQETRTQQYPGNNVNHPGESDQGTLTRDSEEIKRKWSSHMSYNYTIPKFPKYSETGFYCGRDTKYKCSRRKIFDSIYYSSFSSS